MRTTYLAIALALHALLLTGCNSNPHKTAQVPRKTSDQKLGVYTPLRRLTYAGACGSDGPLSISVRRIIVSEQATVVEVKAKNLSSHPYLLRSESGASAVLRTTDNETLAWNGGRSTLAVKSGDSDMQFRMEGVLQGEPVAFQLKNLTPSSKFQKQDVSIVVKLVD